MSHTRGAWPNEFSRLAELQKDAMNQGKHGFFDGIPKGVRTDLGFEYYSELEKELAALDPQAWAHLKHEVLECSMSFDPIRGYGSVIQRLYEAKGYVFLRGCGYTSITFIPRSEKKCKVTPDLRAHSAEHGDALLEVKTIWQSDDENRYVMENTKRLEAGEEPEWQRASPELPDGLKRKLFDVLEKAARQLLQFEPQNVVRRLAYFIIHLDHGPLMADRSYCAIPRLLQDQEKRIEIVCCFRAA